MSKRPNGAPLERDEDGNKYCVAGDHWLPEQGFCRSSKNSDGLSAPCRGCKSAAYRRQHPEVVHRSPGAPLERDAAGNKQCAKCREWLPEAEFHKNTSKSDGLQQRCRPCANHGQNERRWKLHPETARRVGPRRPHGESVKRDASGRKYCPGCAEWLSEPRFTRNPNTADKLQSRCITCCANMKRQGLYSVTPERVAQMLADQDGKCAICEKDISESYYVDHDHACCPGRKSCGQCVRKLLCSLCNTGIGYLQDDAALLMKAAEYLIFQGEWPRPTEAPIPRQECQQVAR